MEETRQCLTCGSTKPLNEENFVYRNKKLGQFTSYCRPCKTKYNNDHYTLHKAEYVPRRAVRNKNYRLHISQFLLSYLQEHPCVDCGEKDPVVLEFDHQRDKVRSLCMMTAAGFSIEKIKTEIDKCEVRCANCHRRRTSQQRGWFRSISGQAIRTNHGTL